MSGAAYVERVASEWERIRAADLQRREREAFEAERRERELAAVATPQTRRKLERRVVDRLLERGQIDEVQAQAAREIEKVFLRVTSITAMKSALLMQSVGGGSLKQFVPAIFQRDYQERFKPWADSEERVGVKAGVNRFAMTLRLVVDNLGQEQVGAEMRMHRRYVLSHWRESLWRYGEIAGWIVPRDLPLLGACSPNVEIAA